MSKEAIKLALDVLKDSQDYKMGRVMTVEAVEALEEALAKQTCEMGEMCLQCPDGLPKQEPDDLMIAYMSGLHDGKKLSKQEQGEPVSYPENFIDALKFDTALRDFEQGEPVAVKRMREWIVALKSRSNNGEHMTIDSGISAGTCWELAVELEQFINTTPQQRTWVGLTNEEIKEIHHQSFGKDIAIATGLTEAKLKQKNGFAEEKNT